MGQTTKKELTAGKQKVKENVDLFYQKLSWDELREQWIKSQQTM